MNLTDIVVDVFGQFSRGEMVACEDRHGERVACGLVNYDAADARRLCGKKSHEKNRKSRLHAPYTRPDQLTPRLIHPRTHEDTHERK